MRELMIPMNEDEQCAWDAFAAAALSRVDIADAHESCEDLTAWSADVADKLLAQRRMRACVYKPPRTP